MPFSSHGCSTTARLSVHSERAIVRYFGANMAAPAAFAESAHLRALVEWITAEVRMLHKTIMLEE